MSSSARTWYTRRMLRCPHVSLVSLQDKTRDWQRKFAHPHVFASLRALRVLSITKQHPLHMLVTRISSIRHTNSSNSSSKLTYFRLLNRLGHAEAQLVETLRYKPEGHGFDSRWCQWIFFLHNPSGRTMALGLTQPLTEMSTRNISWVVKAAGA